MKKMITLAALLAITTALFTSCCTLPKSATTEEPAATDEVSTEAAPEAEAE